MIESKNINIITAIALAVTILIVIVMTAFAYSPSAGAFTASYEPLYVQKIFGADIITVDIAVDEDDWQNMLDNAMNEEYIMADVIINNKRISKVGIRPKGNNSLQQVAASDSDRYSFKIKFDEYVKDQTCFGLDMLILNDMLGDASCMKEYTAFEMMREAGIETPCFGYAKISLNNKDWGLYFALEAYNDSYEKRVSGDVSGNLYNVKSATGQDNFGMENNPDSEDSVDNFNPENFGFGGGMPERGNKDGGFGRGGAGRAGIGASGSGGSLVYTDDNSSSYSAIFGNAVGNDSTEEDFQKVIAALKALNDGENIEDHFDVDEILRYLAVHTVLVNLDSYSSNMAQNYYIYEYGGILQILPWDYNYAWGAFQSEGSSSVVNFPIDTPLSGVEMSERPLISKLFENEEYFTKYHQYLRELMDNYFADGKFGQKIDELNALIGSYVKNDPTAFYTYDEYLTALEAFKTLGELRAGSIYGQLEGAIPSTSEGQRKNSSALIDASSVNLSDLGMGMFGGGMDGFKGGFGNFDKLDKPADSADIGKFGGGFGKNDKFGNFGGKPDFPPDENGGDMPAMGGAPPQNDGFPFGNGESAMPQMPSENGFGAPPQNDFGQEPPQGESKPDDTLKATTPAVLAVYSALLACAIFGVSLVKRKF